MPFIPLDYIHDPIVPFIAIINGVQSLNNFLPITISDTAQDTHRNNILTYVHLLKKFIETNFNKLSHIATLIKDLKLF
jgi:hypothetical protein